MLLLYRKSFLTSLSNTVKGVSGLLSLPLLHCTSASFQKESDIFCWQEGKHWRVTHIWFEELSEAVTVARWKNNVTCQSGARTRPAW